MYFGAHQANRPMVELCQVQYALDYVSFSSLVPLRGLNMDVCVELSHGLGSHGGSVPVAVRTR